MTFLEDMKRWIEALCALAAFTLFGIGWCEALVAMAINDLYLSLGGGLALSAKE